MSKNSRWGLCIGYICMCLVITLAAGCGGNSEPAIIISPDPVTFAGITQGATSSPAMITDKSGEHCAGNFVDQNRRRKSQRFCEQYNLQLDADGCGVLYDFGNIFPDCLWTTLGDDNAHGQCPEFAAGN